MSDVMKGWQKINKVDSSGINKENGKREVHSIMKSNVIMCKNVFNIKNNIRAAPP